MNEISPKISEPSETRKQFIQKCIIAYLLVLVALAGCYYSFTLPPPDVVEADAGFKKARRRINPENLRAWALDKVAKYKGADVTIPHSEIPEYIEKLYREPPEFAVVATGSPNGLVMITWGGGFFHWNLSIGNTNFVEPWRNDQEIAAWVPGIYYVRDSPMYQIK